MYTESISIQAYIFNSSEDCRLCKKSLVMHLLKIAWCMLSWWTSENIANESARPVLSCAFAHKTPIFSLTFISGTADRCCIQSFFLSVVDVRVSGRWYTYAYCMNTITVQRSAAPLVFTNIQSWPLLAPAPGYRAVHHGPLPQALRILGGRCLQGGSDHTESMHSYQSICTSVCTVLYKSQQL